MLWDLSFKWNLNNVYRHSLFVIVEVETYAQTAVFLLTVGLIK
jgi:hypothetical protein